MKIILELLAITLIVGAIFFFYSHEQTSKTYKALSDAKEDGIFQRGWLPDILPLNTFSIHSKTDIDTNKSEGYFFIPENEMTTFKSILNHMKNNNYGFKSFIFAINETTGKVMYTNQSNNSFE